VASTRRPSVMTLRIVQPGELCAMKQSPSSKIRESMLWNTKEQSGRGFNLAASSALRHATVALASPAPELDSTLINKVDKLTDDKAIRRFRRRSPFRSFRYDGNKWRETQRVIHMRAYRKAPKWSRMVSLRVTTPGDRMTSLSL